MGTHSKLAAAISALALAVVMGAGAASALPISQIMGQDWKKACTRADGTVSTVCCTRHANDCLADCGDLTAGSQARQQCDNNCNAAWNTCKSAARGTLPNTTIFQNQGDKTLQLAPQ
jgi:hypothetical protein